MSIKNSKKNCSKEGEVAEAIERNSKKACPHGGGGSKSKFVTPLIFNGPWAGFNLFLKNLSIEKLKLGR